MVRIPHQDFRRRISGLISIFYMETTEVMVGQFKQFLAKPEHESESQPSAVFFLESCGR